MKIVYTWLKDFVDVKATPDELASRLALSGTNIGGIENGPHGAVIDAEVSSNRPDCLGHYGIAREVGAVYKLPLKPISPKPQESTAAKSRRHGARRDSVSRALRPLHRSCNSRRENSALAEMAQGPPRSFRRNQHQQRRRREQLRDARTRHALHAFDYDKVRDHALWSAAPSHPKKSGPSTASSVPSTPGICMICDGDGSRAVGIGGIMGGAETEISFSTKKCVDRVRLVRPHCDSTRHAHPETSHRSLHAFRPRCRPEMAELASRRCAELILQLAGGDLLAGVVDVYPASASPRKFFSLAPSFSASWAPIPPTSKSNPASARSVFAPVRIDQNRAREGSLLAAWECTQPLARRSRARDRSHRRSRPRLRA